MSTTSKTLGSLKQVLSCSTIKIQTVRFKDYSNLCSILQNLVRKSGFLSSVIGNIGIVYIPFSIAESEGGKANRFLYSLIVNINLERKGGI